jgi:hypothetical protein
MTSTSRVVVLVAAMGFLVPGATRAADSPTAEQARRSNEVRKKLASTVTFNGYDDPDLKLGDALENLTRVHGITFAVNEQAFKDEMIDDVLNTPLGKAIPRATNVSLKTVLNRILARVPSSSGTTFVVRGGVVEITTRRYASPSNWHRFDNRLLPPEVSIAFDKRELQEALQEIADATGVNIVLDARAKEKAKTATTATANDAAVDTVVELLADMADLQAVKVEDIIYVTTKENAKALREEKARMKKAEESEPATPNPLGQ